MKTLLLLLPFFFLALAAQAAEPPADVLGLHWGMTADEVGAVMVIEPVEDRPDHFVSKKIDIGSYPFSVHLVIAEHGLSALELTASIPPEQSNGLPEFKSIVQALTAKYEPIEPVLDSVEAPVPNLNAIYTASWELPRTSIEVTLSFLLRIRYTARPGYEVISKL